jgi:hypothetical protein
VRFVRRFIPVVMPSSWLLHRNSYTCARRFRKQTKRLYLAISSNENKYRMAHKHQPNGQ